ncbi:MAG: hydantoinase B/oxoprolinase family protein [Candidatus Atabeyarchaeum deiterrae]
MQIDPITTELIGGALVYASEEMGVALRNSAYSPNIKERMDHSCSIFDSKRRLVAQAEHIPVHLGSLPFGVKNTLTAYTDSLEAGDIILVNDPSVAGTHLPDLMLIKPVFWKKRLLGYVANKAHHSDIGGKTPGSMPSDSTELSQEGLIIPPTKIVEAGRIVQKVMNWITSNVRTPKTTMGDLKAQMAATTIGERRVIEVFERYGSNLVEEAVDRVMTISETRLRKEFARMPDGECEAEDYLEDTGLSERPVKIKVKIKKSGERITLDYSGTDKQVRAPLNAPLGVTLAGVYYTVKCVTDPTIPTNDGFSRPIETHVPEGSILNPVFPAPVAGGNVETSQRNVDTLLKAFAQMIPQKVCAAAQGTMNNVTVGGEESNQGRWSFYETIGGGMGASLGVDGADGVHVHMTNTMNTPIEVIESSYPIRVVKYELRADSGGPGRWRGGVGIERSWTLLADSATVSILAERNKIAPWGLNGGREAARGAYFLLRSDGTQRKIGSKSSFKMNGGDTLIVRTPGGGGYGSPQERDPENVLRDVLNGFVSAEAAEREYCVAIDIKRKSIDWNLTQKLRENRR